MSVSRGHRQLLFYLFLLELQVSAGNFLLKFLPLPLFFPAAPSLLFTHTCPVTDFAVASHLIYSPLHLYLPALSSSAKIKKIKTEIFPWNEAYIQ